jgi:predicted membrane channel-forming protein YqfA (hemolysin III family)
MITLSPTFNLNVGRKDSKANSLTHGAGLILSAAGLAALVILAAMRGSA